MSAKRTLTTDDIEAGYQNDGWLGWGYLGGREHLTDDERTEADAIVLAYANEHGWSAGRLFDWMNSRPGRHFADWPTHPKADTLLGAKLEATR